MAEPTNKSPLMYEVRTPDFSKMNLAGVAEDKGNSDEYDERITSSYQEAQNQRKALADALESRYAQPNLFKIAAGFLKPQLGGFSASLGSASEAMGENIEQQRAIQPTIAQMRAEIAAQEVPLNQQYKANNMLKQALLKPEGMDSTDVATIARYNESVGKIAQEKLTNQRALLADMLSAIESGRAQTELYGKFPKEFVDRHYPALIKLVPGREKEAARFSTPAGGNPPAPSASNVPAAGGGASPSERIAGDLAGINREIERLKKNPGSMTKEQQAGALAILEQEKRQIEGSAPAASTQARGSGAAENQDWANSNYTVSPPPMQPNDTQVSYLERMSQNREQTRKDLAELSYVPKDQNFVARRENLVKMADLLGDRDVREFAKRGSQNELASIVAAALSSDTPPDAVANMVRKSNFITPMDSDAKVKKFQEYIQALAREQAVVNNLIKNPTNQKFGMETAASIQQGTQPEAAFRLIMEELHKMQRQAIMPGLMQPYADAGYGMTDALNSKRVRDYERDWNKVHSKFGPKSNSYKLPSFLTAPDAYSTGFDFRTQGRGQ